jgi:HEAT repeat protein
MRKRLLAAVILLVLISLGIALAIPHSHFAIMGYLKGEPFYDGKASSYWAGALKKDPFVGDLGDVAKTLREGGPAAVPVLCRLLAHEDDKVRSQALITLRLIDWDPAYVAPTLTRMFVLDRGPDFLIRAISVLAGKDPSVFAKELDWALNEERGPDRRAEIGLILGTLGLEGWGHALEVTLQQGPLVLKLQAADLWWDRTHDARAVIPILVECLQAEDSNIRESAASLVRNVAPTQKAALRPRLVELLKHQDGAIRARAASLLMYTGPDHAAVGACLRALTDEAPVRRQAAMTLNSLGPLSEDVRTQLFRMLTERDAGTRLSAAALLLSDGQTANPTILEALVDALRRSQDPIDRATGALAAGSAKPVSPQAIRALIDVVTHDAGDAVRRAGTVRNDPVNAAITALGQIGPTAKDAVAVLMRVMEKHESLAVRINAARALGTIARSEQPVRVLLAALTSPLHPELRARAAEALGRLGIRRNDVSVALSAALNDPSVKVRCSAAESLSMLDPQNKNGVVAMIQLAKSKDESDATEAVRALGNMKSRVQETVPVLREVLERRKNLDTAAIDALGRIGPAAKPSLCLIRNYLKSPSPRMRLIAATAFWKIDGNANTAVSVLVELLGDKDEWVRERAAEALGEIGPQANSATPVLRGSLDDDYAAVRRAAAKSLKAIKRTPCFQSDGCKFKRNVNFPLDRVISTII